MGLDKAFGVYQFAYFLIIINNRDCIMKYDWKEFGINQYGSTEQVFIVQIQRIYNLETNTEKTKIVAVGKGDKKILVRLNYKNVEVSAFRYLGVNIHKDVKNETKNT